MTKADFDEPEIVITSDNSLTVMSDSHEEARATISDIIGTARALMHLGIPAGKALLKDALALHTMVDRMQEAYQVELHSRYQDALRYTGQMLEATLAGIDIGGAAELQDKEPK